MKKTTLCGIGLLFAMPVFAEQSKYLQEMTKHWKTAKELNLAVAQAMPEASYDFKPNPEEMSFGQLMNHMATANASYVGRAAGVKSPIVKPENMDKATMIKQLTESFDFCIKSLEGMKDDQLDNMVGQAPRQMSAREALLGGFVHNAHHRGQAEVYLRVKDIKPPDYKF